MYRIIDCLDLFDTGRYPMLDHDLPLVAKKKRENLLIYYSLICLYCQEITDHSSVEPLRFEEGYAGTFYENQKHLQG